MRLISDLEAAEGAAVIVNYARDQAGAERVVREITGKGGRAIAVQGDVAQRSDAQRLVAEAKKAFGRLDVLVNNAGVFSFAPFEQFSEQEFHRQFNTNVLGMFLMIEAALPAFGAEGGSIINIGSTTSATAYPLGIDMPYKFDQPPMRGFAINGASRVSGWKNGEVAKNLYVAFTAKSADAVRASYKAAIDAGATSTKEPSLRPRMACRLLRGKHRRPGRIQHRDCPYALALTNKTYEPSDRTLRPAAIVRHRAAAAAIVFRRLNLNIQRADYWGANLNDLALQEGAERQLRRFEWEGCDRLTGRDRRSSAS